MQTKKVLALLTIAVLVTALLSYSVWGPNVSFTTYVEEGSQVTESSYILFKDGSTYYLRDGESGEVPTSGTNASAIVNAYMDNYTTFTFKTPAGSYDPIILTHPILLENYTRFVTFQGEGDSGLLQLDDAANCDVFRVEAGCHWITWRGLYIHGNDAEQTGTSHGIHFLTGDTTTSDIEINDNAIVNFNGSPIYFEGTVSASYVSNNFIEDSADACIRIGGLHGTTIEFNLLWNSEYGIQVENTTRARQDNAFVGNIINEMTETGIFLNNSHNNIITDNRISSCTDGIYANVMYYSTISDNWLITIQESGMLLYSMQFDTISNNNVYGCSQLTNNTYSGIIMGAEGSGECHSNLITGNMITNTNWDNKTVFGFYIAGNYNIVTDMHATGSDAPIFEVGTGNEVHDCFNGTDTYIS